MLIFFCISSSTNRQELSLEYNIQSPIAISQTMKSSDNIISFPSKSMVAIISMSGAILFAFLIIYFMRKQDDIIIDYRKAISQILKDIRLLPWSQRRRPYGEQIRFVKRKECFRDDKTHYLHIKVWDITKNMKGDPIRLLELETPFFLNEGQHLIFIHKLTSHPYDANINCTIILAGLREKIIETQRLLRTTRSEKENIFLCYDEEYLSIIFKLYFKINNILDLIFASKIKSGIKIKENLFENKEKEIYSAIINAFKKQGRNKEPPVYFIALHEDICNFVIKMVNIRWKQYILYFLKRKYDDPVKIWW